MRADVRRKIHKTVQSIQPTREGKLDWQTVLFVTGMLTGIETDHGKFARKEAEVEFHLAFKDAGIDYKVC